MFVNESDVISHKSITSDNKLWPSGTPDYILHMQLTSDTLLSKHLGNTTYQSICIGLYVDSFSKQHDNAHMAMHLITQRQLVVWDPVCDICYDFW